MSFTLVIFPCYYYTICYSIFITYCIVMTNNDLANLLFPDVTETISDLQHKYPPRPDGQVVVRIAPSPTGFIHFGSVFIAIVDYMFAHDNGGVFLMRVEDTDQKRLVK